MHIKTSSHNEISKHKHEAHQPITFTTRNKKVDNNNGANKADCFEDMKIKRERNVHSPRNQDSERNLKGACELTSNKIKILHHKNSDLGG